jgi:hypothetical protein
MLDCNSFLSLFLINLTYTLPAPPPPNRYKYKLPALLTLIIQYIGSWGNVLYFLKLYLHVWWTMYKNLKLLGSHVYTTASYTKPIIFCANLVTH